EAVQKPAARGGFHRVFLSTPSGRRVGFVHRADVLQEGREGLPDPKTLGDSRVPGTTGTQWYTSGVSVIQPVNSETSVHLRERKDAGATRRKPTGGQPATSVLRLGELRTEGGRVFRVVR